MCMPDTTSDPFATVLLLMDPTTRRFELLQLEFETKNATVADILQQIPIAATEECLRTQSFNCVYDMDGNEYDDGKPLSECGKSNPVVITVPKTYTKGALHAANMAKPILSEPKVQEMLSSLNEMTAVAPSQNTISAPVTKSSRLSSLIIMGAAAVYAAYLVAKFQTEITKPLGVGSTLAPGAWKSRCGLVQADCKPAYIEMGIDGTLQIVENEGVTFSLIGNVCEEEDESCVPGAEIFEDGTLKIGGVPAKLVMKSQTSLNPWPFDEGIGPMKVRKAWF
jgi:hypothetical protein